MESIMESIMEKQKRIHVFINKAKFELETPLQLGAALKQLAGIPLQDVLFLQSHGDDVVITNDGTIKLKDCDHFHSQPPADYGLHESCLREAGLDHTRVTVHKQPDGWTFLAILGYTLPGGFAPGNADLLVKLPPGFPDAQPDMFWVHPALKTASGTIPRATSIESLLGKEWQRYSWHLQPGAWIPGVSTLRDFMRCIAARFLRED